MRFEQLRYFEAAVRTGSFRQAAREVGVSQPTITSQVQRLEEDLGLILLRRGTHGVQATDAAERILPHARAAIRAEGMMRQEASAIDGLRIGTTKLATVSTGSMLVLPAMVSKLHADHPNICFEVTEEGSRRVAAGVAKGAYDMGLVTRLGDEYFEPEHLRHIDLMFGRLVLCVADSHPLAGSVAFDADLLDGERFVTYREGSALREAMERVMLGKRADIVYITDGAETAQRMVREGIGITIANTLATSTVSGNGVTLIPLPYDWARTSLSAVIRTGELHSPIVQLLLGEMKAIVNDRELGQAVGTDQGRRPVAGRV